MGTWPGHSGNTTEPGGNVARSQLRYDRIMIRRWPGRWDPSFVLPVF